MCRQGGGFGGASSYLKNMNSEKYRYLEMNVKMLAGSVTVSMKTVTIYG